MPRQGTCPPSRRHAAGAPAGRTDASTPRSAFGSHGVERRWASDRTAGSYRLAHTQDPFEEVDEPVEEGLPVVLAHHDHVVALELGRGLALLEFVEVVGRYRDLA